ncbi:MAG: hypothetical protein M0R06_25080 [Sphaerochaeta sp.]|jgi:hypothetical protein|nr:hypothetical protein [Sphaerochaeta sp.]
MLLPRDKCPIIEARYYLSPRGSEPRQPTEFCGVHIPGPTPPPEPPPVPPLPDKAKYPLYLFIPELLVADGDLDLLCKNFRAAGGHGIRFFLLQSWSTKRLVPWEQAKIGDESIWIDIPEEVLRTPVTDLDRPNKEYWTRLRDVLTILKKNDLSCIASLGDNCSMNTHEQFLSYPFLASLDTMSCEVIPYVQPYAARALCTESPGGLYGPDKYNRFKDWVCQVRSALEFSGVEYRMEIQNEFSRLGWPDDTPERWYTMMMGQTGGDVVHSGDESVCLNFAGTFSMHQIERAGMFPTECPMDRLMLSGDGGYAGPYAGRSETDLDVEGRRGLSVPDAVAIAEMIDEKGIMGGYEWMPKYPWRHDDCGADVDGQVMEVPAAMTAEWK